MCALWAFDGLVAKTMPRLRPPMPKLSAAAVVVVAVVVGDGNAYIVLSATCATGFMILVTLRCTTFYSHPVAV